MSNIQKQHKISPAIAWLTIQKFIIFYCPLDGEHTSFPHVDIFLYYTKLFFSVQNAGSPCFVICKSVHHQYRRYLCLFVYIIHQVTALESSGYSYTFFLPISIPTVFSFIWSPVSYISSVCSFSSCFFFFLASLNSLKNDFIIWLHSSSMTPVVNST